MAENLILSWGKPAIYLQKIGDTSATWIKMYDAKEDTVTLETTKGDKTEAKVEGGENEAVRYNKNTYTLNWSHRISQGHKKLIEDEDGIIAGEYKVIVVPEDSSAVAICFERATLSCETSFSAADGIEVAYAADALQPDSGNQVKLGTATVTDDTPTFVEATA